MDDTQMLDWLQRHITSFRFVNEDAFKGSLYCLEWVNAKGFPRKTLGCDLRDCVRGAVVGLT